MSESDDLERAQHQLSVTKTKLESYLSERDKTNESLDDLIFKEEEARNRILKKESGLELGEGYDFSEIIRNVGGSVRSYVDTILATVNNISVKFAAAQALQFKELDTPLHKHIKNVVRKWMKSHPPKRQSKQQVRRVQQANFNAFLITFKKRMRNYSEILRKIYLAEIMIGNLNDLIEKTRTEIMSRVMEVEKLENLQATEEDGPRQASSFMFSTDPHPRKRPTTFSDSGSTTPTNIQSDVPTSDEETIRLNRDLYYKQIDFAIDKKQALDTRGDNQLMVPTSKIKDQLHSIFKSVLITESGESVEFISWLVYYTMRLVESEYYSEYDTENVKNIENITRAIKTRQLEIVSLFATQQSCRDRQLEFIQKLTENFKNSLMDMLRSYDELNRLEGNLDVLSERFPDPTSRKRPTSFSDSGSTTPTNIQSDVPTVHKSSTLSYVSKAHSSSSLVSSGSGCPVESNSKLATALRQLRSPDPLSYSLTDILRQFNDEEESGDPIGEGVILTYDLEDMNKRHALVSQMMEKIRQRHWQ